MGFFDGKLSVFRLGLGSRSGHAKCPETAGASPTRRHQQSYRKKRFHVFPRALGEDFYKYNLATPAQPKQPSAMPAPPLRPAAEPLATEIEPKALSDLEVARQPAQRGMRICAWALWIVLACIHYKQIAALWVLAARGWPGLH